MNSVNQKAVIPWPLVVLFIVVSVSAILVGILYYDNQRNTSLTNRQTELSAIADLKVRQISQWRRERIADGIYLSNSTTLIGDFHAFIDIDSTESREKDLKKNLKALVDNYDYRNALLLDSKGKVRLYYPDQDTILGDYLAPMVDGIIRAGKVILTDLHRTGKVSFVHLDLLVPLRINQPGDTALFGMLVLRIDPKEVLYPLIQTWPVSSKTAESLLIRREVDEVVYLNELRHLENTELALRRSVTSERLPAALALQGMTGITDGIDYRGQRVIAAMKKVPESPWYMVAKIDRSEVLAYLHSQVSLLVIIIILFILATGTSLGFIWWNQQLRFYREKYEAELDRLALVKHFDYILKYANDIIFLVNEDFEIVEVNDRAVETIKFERKDLIGKNIVEFCLPESISVVEKFRKVIDEAGNATFEIVVVRNDGSAFPVEISARSVDIEGSKYYQAIGRDITERKIAEEILRESEEKFRKIFEESPFAMLMSGKDMGILMVNASFSEMIGYTEEELLGSTFRSITHHEHISNDEVSLLRLVAGEIPVYHTIKKYLRKDGSVIWGSTTVSIIRNNKGEVHFFLAMVEDITLRKKAEDDLEKSFSLVKATFESTADGILVVDNKGRIVQYNQKFADMWRIPDELLKQRIDDAAIKYVLDQLRYPDQFVKKVRDLYNDPEAVTSDLLEFNDGRFFERYSQPQKIAGKTVGRVWSFRDITERKKAEAELIAAKEKAEESDRLKTAFLHNVSHEIRTPMNAIIGFSTLLGEPDITEADSKQFTDIIIQSGNQLLSIINDIVDLASIESGQMKLNIRKLNLNETLRGLNEQFGYKQKLHNVTLILNTPLPDTATDILADKTKLVQIISNLINNSFKFTKQGSIEFGYQTNNNLLEFYVRDTGIGIPKEHHEKIFDRFYQVDSSVSRQYSGTGLGLSICKAYVGLLGGEIHVDSNPGEGTVITFTLPYLRVDNSENR
ncbi:MAG: PAS domain S-box protein [Bacteroidales bacterium]|nr:PAS domain S-box protein [Bacteroidales bacterium]